MLHIIKKMFCKHNEIVHVLNIHGDYINYISPIGKTYRSIWRCKKCDKFIYKEQLGPEKKVNLNGR